MKTTALILILCALASPGHAADKEPEYSASRVVELINSLPTPAEKQEWDAYFNKPESQRDKVDVKLARKMKNRTAKFLELYHQIKPGKSIFDYPGILSLGYVNWEPRGKRSYELLVYHLGSPGVGGFSCEFTESGVITGKFLSYITQ